MFNSMMDGNQGRVVGTCFHLQFESRDPSVEEVGSGAQLRVPAAPCLVSPRGACRSRPPLPTPAPAPGRPGPSTPSRPASGPEPVPPAAAFGRSRAAVVMQAARGLARQRPSFIRRAQRSGGQHAGASKLAGARGAVTRPTAAATPRRRARVRRRLSAAVPTRSEPAMADVGGGNRHDPG